MSNTQIESTDDRRHREYLEQKGQLQDDGGNWQFDESGYFDTMPGRRVGLEAQYATNRYVAGRNRESREAAIGAMRKGLGLMESYRPGGQAALASGMYQGLAEFHYRNQMDTPDQLARWRDHIRKKAQHRATQARTMQTVAAVVAGVATMGVGLAAGAGLGAAALGGLGTAASGVGAAQGGGGQQQGNGYAQALGQIGAANRAPQQQPAAQQQATAGPTPDQQFFNGPVMGGYGGGGGGQVGGGAGQQGQQVGGGGQKRLGGGAGPQQGGQQQQGGPQVSGGGQSMGGPQGGMQGGGVSPSGLVATAPPSPVTPYGTPATQITYATAEDTAAVNSEYWEQELMGMDGFFAGLQAMIMAR